AAAGGAMLEDGPASGTSAAGAEPPRGFPDDLAEAVMTEVRSIAWERVGILRDAAGLASAVHRLEEILGEPGGMGGRDGEGVEEGAQGEGNEGGILERPGRGGTGGAVKRTAGAGTLAAGRIAPDTLAAGTNAGSPRGARAGGGPLRASAPGIGGDSTTRRGLEARNMTLVAAMIARCALFREESRGAHCRTDFPA